MNAANGVARKGSAPATAAPQRVLSVFDGVMIIVGTALLHQFHWMIYVFGGLLLLTAVKLMLSSDDEIDPETNPLVKIARRIYPVSAQLDGNHFFTRLNGQRAVTPLFLVLLVVESTDVLFAIDSIPAIFAITTDPFLVFTSNVFAILGLRSLYFALASLIENFRYLKQSLVFLLAYIGVKMMMTDIYPIPVEFSLAMIVAILAIGVVASLVVTYRHEVKPMTPEEESSMF